MILSRRDLTLLLPVLVAVDSEAHQSKEPGDPHSTRMPVLASKAYEFNELPIRTSPNGAVKSRPVFNGVTGRGQRVAMHISQLAPGEAPHAPARQPHEEVIIIREGTLEVTLNGQTSTLGPGSVIFSNFNDLNGWKNVGTSPAEYYVLSLEEHSG